MTDLQRLDEAIEWTETWIGDAVWEVQVLTEAAREWRRVLAEGRKPDPDRGFEEKKAVS